MTINRTGEGGSSVIYAGNSRQVARQQEEESKKATAGKRGTVFAGDLNLDRDLYSKNKENSVKKSIKSIMDVYENQLKVDQGLDESVEKQKQLKANALQAQSQIDNLRGQKAELKDNYQISDDSQEQKDLELLQKSMEPGAKLSEDEQKRLQEMPSLTEYQKDSLSYDAQIAVWQQRKDNAIAGYEGSVKSVIDTKLELLKSDPMTDAQRQAAKIMKSAAKEAVGLLMQETKENIDDKIEEKKEETEKVKEKEKEQEEKIENAKENSVKYEQNVVSDQSEPNQVQEEVQEQVTNKDGMDRELKDLMKKQKLLEEDLKGISIDTFL